MSLLKCGRCGRTYDDKTTSIYYAKYLNSAEDFWRYDVQVDADMGYYNLNLCLPCRSSLYAWINKEGNNG